jgi:hypothetical protein
MRWIVPPRYEANYMLVINSFHSSNQTKIWGVRKWWTTPLFSNQFDNTCTINCRVLFLRRHSMFFIKKGRKCLDTTKQNIQQPRASREIYTEVKKTKQSRPRLQTKPKRPRWKKQNRADQDYKRSLSDQENQCPRTLPWPIFELPPRSMAQAQWAEVRLCHESADSTPSTTTRRPTEPENQKLCARAYEPVSW